MNADVAAFNTIITNSRFRIPFFQRRYVWNTPEWTRFLEDIELLEHRPSTYFLGSIILKKTGVDRGFTEYEVIDGQQRFTTLFLFMKFLHLKAGNNRDFIRAYMRAGNSTLPILDHNQDDRQSFERILNREGADTPITNPRNIIEQAYVFFQNHYNDQERALTAEQAQELIDRIYNMIRMVRITVDQDDDEQQIFDTINTLGVDLNTDELVKNFLYQAEDEQLYNQNWRPVFDAEDADSFWRTDLTAKRQDKQKKEDKTIEKFFHAFIHIKISDFDINDTDRKIFTRQDELANTCKRFINNFNVDKQDLANEIISYAKLYKKYFDPQILDSPIPRENGADRLAYIILAAKTPTVIPYFLYILTKVTDANEQRMIFGYLETYLVRRLLTQRGSNDYYRLFGEYLFKGKAFSFATLFEFISEKDHTTNLAMPDYDEIKRATNSRTKDIGEDTARLILYLYEAKTHNITSSYNEHRAVSLMAANADATRGWERYDRNTDEEDLRQQLTKTLGNYFLIEDGRNRVRGAYTPAQKIAEIAEYCNYARINEGGHEDNQRYYRVNYGLTSPNTRELKTNWTSKDISERNTTLATGICKLWPLPEQN